MNSVFRATNQQCVGGFGHQCDREVTRSTIYWTQIHNESKEVNRH